MIPFLQRGKRTRSVTVGVAFTGDGAAVARVRPGSRDTAPQVELLTWLPATDPATLAERLAACVDEHDLGRAHTVGIVAPGDYQVLQVDAPNVPPAEMAQAAAWRVRELTEIPLDQAVVDTFPPPESAQRGNRQINVVVARRSTMAERAETLKSAGLRPVALDIPELAQRTVCAHLPESRGGHGLLALGDSAGLLTLYREGELYLARSLDSGQATLADADGGALDTLLLEVQRSFDYFESALSQPPLGSLYIYPRSDDTQRLATAVTENLASVECHCVDVNDIAGLTEEPDPAIAGAPVLHAVGAALRSTAAAGDQGINLHQDTDRRARQPVDSVHIAVASVVTLVVLAGLTGYGWWRADRAEAAAAAAAAERDALEQETAALTEELQALRRDADRDELAPLRAELAAKRQLRDYLAEGPLAERDGFSSHLQGLARQVVDDLWLTRIDLTAGGSQMRLRGRTLDPDRVPAFISGLRAEAPYEGQIFRRFAIERAEEEPNHLVFDLASEPGDGDNGDGG